MTSRERFVNALAFKPVDRFPLHELTPSDEMLQQWRTEGMPPDVTFGAYFGLDRTESVALDMRSRPKMQKFDELRDAAVLRKYYDAATPERYPTDLAQKAAAWRGRDFPLHVQAWQAGFFQIMRVGDAATLTEALLSLYDEPMLAHRVMDYVSDFFLECLGKALREVQPDYAVFGEPIAHNQGPVISPKMFREFVFPYYRKVTTFLRQHGVTHIILETMCNVWPLLPICIEAGITGLYCGMTRNASMDYLRVRREFGKSLALIGGIDAGPLLKGKKAIDAELARTVPPLLASGGYIPHLDARARNLPLESFRYYRAALNRMAQS
ncbi:MAG: hypothetical protein FJ278_01970 [Planctomycetes bacterium]|nr:hypothetical protein [Planctomycetota bacterium]